MEAFLAVIRPGGTPTGSVDFVAYLARYAATLVLVTSPSPVSRTTCGSIWAPQVISHPLGLHGVGDGGEPRGARCLLNDLGQHLGSERRVGRDASLGMDGIVAIEAEDGVEVDQAAPLELSDFGVGELHPGAVSLGELVQAAADGDRGTPPQLGGVGVPH